MLNTSKSLIIVAAYKRRICTILSAMTLILFSSSIQASNSSYTNSNLTNVVIVPASYCYSNNAKTNAHVGYPKQQTIECLLTQLSFYQQQTLSSHQQYFAYKAQALLNYASYQSSIKRPSITGLQALESSIIILKELQSNNDKNLSLITAIPSSSALMRPDLWAILSALKDSSLKDDTGTITAPHELAFSEVALIWAAADQCQHGSRQSGLHFRTAERWLEQAREAYVDVHDSKTNVALEDSIVNYYEQYAPLDATDDICRGLSLPLKNETVTSIAVMNSLIN